MSRSNRSVRVAWTLMILSFATAAVGVALFTELGQMLNLPSEWLYGVHPHLGWISGLVALVVLIVLYLHFAKEMLGRKLIIGYAVLTLGMVLFTNFFVPYLWLRGQHHTAEYISVEEADGLLNDDDDVFVLVIKGQARAYPRNWMMVPHIAGGTLGDENVAMTYCVLSNLPYGAYCHLAKHAGEDVLTNLKGLASRITLVTSEDLRVDLVHAGYHIDATIVVEPDRFKRFVFRTTTANRGSVAEQFP